MNKRAVGMRTIPASERRWEFQLQRPMSLYEFGAGGTMKPIRERALPPQKVIVVGNPVIRWVRDCPKLLARIITTTGSRAFKEEPLFLQIEEAEIDSSRNERAKEWRQLYDTVFHLQLPEPNNQQEANRQHDLKRAELELRDDLVAAWQDLLRPHLQLVPKVDILQRLGL